MTKKYFITGISTDVGKTIVSAYLVEKLKADYWKPIQAGDLEFSDTDKVKSLVSNKKSVFFPNAYALKTPMSPHAAAAIDKVQIDICKITTPKTKNTLIIEGAGGLLVPLNNTHTILDLIPKDAIVVVVIKHYLGSINHSLLTIGLLQSKGYKVVMVYNGKPNIESEAIIESKTNVKLLCRVPFFKELSSKEIKKQYIKVKHTFC